LFEINKKEIRFQQPMFFYIVNKVSIKIKKKDIIASHLKLENCKKKKNNKEQKEMGIFH
jgi:hypothetical protein